MVSPPTLNLSLELVDNSKVEVDSVDLVVVETMVDLASNSSPPVVAVVVWDLTILWLLWLLIPDSRELELPFSKTLSF
jgi:hypothetical protein